MEVADEKKRLIPTKSQHKYQRTVWVVGGLASVALLVVIELFHTQGYITVGNLDFFGMVERAKLLPGDLRAWVQGFYPVGIPLLLKAGLVLGVDVVRTGQIVSIIGGIACMYGGALLALSLTRSRAMALLVMAYLLTTKAFLAYAGYEGTDMLAAGLQVLAIGILSRNLRHRQTVLVAGTINGLAYLARYTALVTLLVCLTYLLALTVYRRERRGFWTALIYGLGFLIGASPQLVPSLLVTGNPLYQTQAYHIWIKLYANSDFVRVNMQPTPVDITLWELFWLSPRRFITNWWQEFLRFWAKSDVPLENHLLAQFAKAGFLFAALDEQRLSAEHRALLSFLVVGIVGILSTFTIKTRFLINMIPVLMVCALYFLWRILPAGLKIGKFQIPVNLLVLSMLWATFLPIPWRFAHTGGSDPRPEVVETSNMLQAAGAQTAEEVLSTNLSHQDVSSLTRDRFTMLYSTEAPPTAAGLRQLMLESGYRFLFYGSSKGLRYHPQYAELLYLEDSPHGYTPIWASPAWAEENERFAVYRIEPQNPAPQVSKRVDWVGGISLLGYDLSCNEDEPAGSGNRVGVYLYWQTTEPLSQSLKAFVHLLGPQGDLVAQHDSVPVLWTRPTSDWHPQETVVDFHWMHVPSDMPADNYKIAVGLYEESTEERWPVRSNSTGHNHVVLTDIGLK